jgi:hypothetical protein
MSKSDSVNAQTQTYIADTGLISIGPAQILRLSVASAGSETVTIRFRKTEYVDSSVSGSVVRKQMLSQTTSDAITIAPGQAASIDFQYTIKDVRGEVISSSRNLRVNAFVVDSNTSSSGGSDVIPQSQISFNFTP